MEISPILSKSPSCSVTGTPVGIRTSFTYVPLTVPTRHGTIGVHRREIDVRKNSGDRIRSPDRRLIPSAEKKCSPGGDIDEAMPSAFGRRHPRRLHRRLIGVDLAADEALEQRVRLA